MLDYFKSFGAAPVPSERSMESPIKESANDSLPLLSNSFASSSPMASVSSAAAQSNQASASIAPINPQHKLIQLVTQSLNYEKPLFSKLIAKPNPEIIAQLTDFLQRTPSGLLDFNAPCNHFPSVIANLLFNVRQTMDYPFFKEILTSENINWHCAMDDYYDKNYKGVSLLFLLIDVLIHKHQESFQILIKLFERADLPWIGRSTHKQISPLGMLLYCYDRSNFHLLLENYIIKTSLGVNLAGLIALQEEVGAQLSKEHLTRLEFLVAWKEAMQVPEGEILNPLKQKYDKVFSLKEAAIKAGLTEIVYYFALLHKKYKEYSSYYLCILSLKPDCWFYASARAALAVELLNNTFSVGLDDEERITKALELSCGSVKHIARAAAEHYIYNYQIPPFVAFSNSAKERQVIATTVQYATGSEINARIGCLNLAKEVIALTAEVERLKMCSP